MDKDFEGEKAKNLFNSQISSMGRNQGEMGGVNDLIIKVSSFHTRPSYATLGSFPDRIS